MAEELGYREEHTGGSVDIYLAGELDIYSSEGFKEKLYNTADTTDVDLKIHCDNLRYIDSTGLGIFVGALKRVKGKNKNIILINLKDNLKKLFIITGLDKVFIIEE
ncbi:STAS domain-containing protein [Pseudobacteroides cellulosolvens]|uniref:Anti-sigma factor antagonist n=1 Tax=Pseudobacteroides cellulosolvens ATCC 35603 = DSM 2933 TaxID=398512 RepID=A0A0L6JMY1_9FIRM|nr:STAS domain-containing protein [Pseudobacteroides cellulosolvens]KNY27148.1 anti-sigma-factor antagonist [Pseudobacteroides cellulosolvens ATCC 35603 = DSM 2933]